MAPAAASHPPSRPPLPIPFPSPRSHHRQRAPHPSHRFQTTRYRHNHRLGSALVAGGLGPLLLPAAVARLRLLLTLLPARRRQLRLPRHGRRLAPAQHRRRQRRALARADGPLGHDHHAAGGLGQLLRERGQAGRGGLARGERAAAGEVPAADEGPLLRGRDLLPAVRAALRVLGNGLREPQPVPTVLCRRQPVACLWNKHSVLKTGAAPAKGSCSGSESALGRSRRPSPTAHARAARPPR